jgi:alpha-amylase/alpha-mannosidase (GH57 family)
MHQPSYRDAETGTFLLPWCRLHATKDYRDMAALLRRYPRVHATFNLTPVLLEQLEAIAGGQSDRYLAVARRPAAELSEDDRRFLLARFFDLNHERMLEPHAAYRELHRRAHEPWGDQDFLDLQVWFHLAWVDPSYSGEEPIRSLFQKGRGFTEAEKNALLDWGIACAGKVAGEYRALAATGQIEISTSAYHHPILPLLIDSDSPRESSPSIPLPSPAFRAPEDAAEQVRRARASHERRFGALPRGTWPPEGAVSDAALTLLARAGFEWAASDEVVLAAALEKRDGELRGWPAPLHRAYRVEGAAGPISIVFRDRVLSDLIGFTYARWDPGQAADDFLRRVRDTRRTAPDGSSPLVTVILDGENCWETYPEDGIPFLSALYDRLQSGSDIEPVTVSEALERVPATERLEHVPVGSWIRADLGIWVGHAEKNRAWEELGAARRAVSQAIESNRKSAEQALEELYVAEASDWFWWYGDDHPSAHRAELDRLFRARLIRAYRCLGLDAPASLEKSLRAEAPGAEEAAGIYRPEGAAGTAHRVAGAVRRIWYDAAGGRELRVRVDLAGTAGEEVGDFVAIVFAGAPEWRARAPLGAAREGPIQWSAKSQTGKAPEQGRYSLDGPVAEMWVPFPGDRPGAGQGIDFRVILERGGRDEEVAPLSGWFHVA